MGRDYKEIVSELWNKVPKMLEKAEENVEKLNGRYNVLIDILFDLFDDSDFDYDALEEVEDSLYKAEETLERCQAMMDTLENEPFIDIVYAYFDGFFELDGEIE